jgi:hypothetical protein
VSPDDPGKRQEEAIAELTVFLAERTRLAVIDPLAARSIAVRLYQAGWRRVRRPDGTPVGR